jgi:FAD/FMN-containing dehydrogenase
LKRITEERQLAELSKDGGMTELRPAEVYLADGEEEVLSILRVSARSGLPITPRASGTSIPGQAVGSGILLLLQERKTGTKVSIGPDGTVSCEPSLVKAELNDIIGRQGRWMPVDPSSYKTCSIGGMIANNSSGARALKYHSTIDYISELTVVLPEEGTVVIRPLSLEEAMSGSGSTRRVAELIVNNQRIISAEIPKVTKNSTGYRLERIVHDGIFDLPKLFVGSEGTLGVTLETKIRTIKKRPFRVLAVFEVSLGELDKLTKELRRLEPSAIELLDKKLLMQTGREAVLRRYSRKDEDDYLVFCEFDGELQEEIDRAIEGLSMEEGLVQYEPIVLTDASDVATAWDLRTETLTLAGELRKGQRTVVPGVEDLVVPPEKLGSLVKLTLEAFEERGLEYIMYGHAGDANLHSRPFLDRGSNAELKILRDLMEDCFEAVWKMGGSISGEHGDGRLRAPYVARQYKKTYELMRQIKRVYDPKSVMNSGVKILPAS